MSIGKIIGTGLQGLSSSKVVQKVCKNGANHLKISPVVTQKVAGQPIKINLMTGSQTTKFADGTRSIVLGSGNGLSKLLGVGSNIVSYPKGSFMGGADGLIAFFKKGTNAPMSFIPKEFGEFVKMLKKLG